MRRDAETGEAGAERPPQVVQGPMRQRLAAIELGDVPIEPLFGPDVMDLRTTNHVLPAAWERAAEGAQDLNRRRRQWDDVRLVRLHPIGRDGPPPGVELVEF